ncbi:MULTISPECIES: hypothetical protein [Acinetobacter]|uniref:hypothetical protein n=1 Tax=Acinetobacter TaxID=469 RepID=UPI0002AE8415|nr:MULTISPECIES: hypothetical protein [Acinetobacter]ELW82009.1 hypothetical protein ACINWC743_1564 [Acinetobacter sp. WC-743]
MNHKKFEDEFKKLPSYQRLIFIHGERLFIRDADVYRVIAVQAAYEFQVRKS